MGFPKPHPWATTVLCILPCHWQVGTASSLQDLPARDPVKDLTVYMRGTSLSRCQGISSQFFLEKKNLSCWTCTFVFCFSFCFCFLFFPNISPPSDSLSYSQTQTQPPCPHVPPKKSMFVSKDQTVKDRIKGESTPHSHNMQRKIKIPWLRVCVCFLGCRNKVRQIAWLKTLIFTFSKFWRPQKNESWYQLSESNI